MTPAGVDARPVVAVFRLQLFKRSETFIASQAQALVRYRPVYVGRRTFGPAPAGARVVTAGGARLGALRLVLFADVRPLAAALGELRPALVHAHFGVDGVYALALARRLGAPLVVTLHGFDVSRSRLSLLASLRPALVRAVLGWRGLARGAARLLAVSTTVAEAAGRRGAPASRLRRLPVGVDLQRLRPVGPGRPGRIVFVGRLVEKKGVDVLIEAFRRLPMEAGRARLLIVGDGPLRPALAAQAARAGLSARIGFAGALDHVATLCEMAQAEVVAVPSRVARNGDAEGLPTVVLEAAALGRAIVASDAGGPAEVLQDGVSALLVRADAPDALAAALARLLADRDLRARLGRAARRSVEADYDLRRQTGRLEDLYDEVRSERSGRG